MVQLPSYHVREHAADQGWGTLQSFPDAPAVQDRLVQRALLKLPRLHSAPECAVRIDDLSSRTRVQGKHTIFLLPKRQ